MKIRLLSFLVSFCLAFNSIILLTPEAYSQNKIPDDPGSVSTLDSYFSNPNSAHPLDKFHLVHQTVYPFKKPHLIEADKLELSFRAQGGDKAFARDFVNAESDKISQPATQAEGKLKLRFQDSDILRFDFPIESATFYENYLVILKKDSFDDKTQTQNLHFVDLNLFSLSLGKSALPVFSLPIQSSGPMYGLAIVDGKIGLGDTLIPAEAFQKISEVQSMLFNVSVNLIDPLIYDSLGESMDDLLQLFELQMQNYEAEVGPQLTDKPALERSLLQISNESKQYVQDARQFQQKILSVSEQQKEMHASSELFLKKVMSEHKLFTDKTLTVQKSLMAKRSLLNRIGLLWSKLSFPRPDGAPHLQQALAFTAVAANKKSRTAFYEQIGGRKEAWLNLAHYASKGAVIAGAAALAVTAPEVYLSFYQQGLSIGASIVDKTVEFGGIAKTALKQSFGFLTDWGVIYRAFLAPDKITKTAIGLTTTSIILALPLVTTHLAINIKSLAQDFKAEKKHYALSNSISDFETLNRYGSFLGGLINSIEKVNQNVGSFLAFLPERQTQKRMEYLAYASSSVDSNANSKRVFTEEETQKVEKIFEQIKKEKLNNGLVAKLKRFTNNVQRSFFFNFGDGIGGLSSELMLELDSLEQEGTSDIFSRVLDNVCDDLQCEPTSEKLERARYVHDHFEKLLMDAKKDISIASWIAAETDELQNYRRIEDSLIHLKDSIENISQMNESSFTKGIRKLKANVSSWKIFNKSKKGLKIESVSGALFHFLTSTPMLTKTIAELANWWNRYFGLRNFIFSPSSLYNFIAYPQYLNTVLAIDETTKASKSKNTLHPPSQLNGAYRSRLEEVGMSLFSSSALENLKAFEKKVLPIEQEIYKHAFKKVMFDLPKYTQDAKIIEMLISNGGPQALHDDSIVQLNWEYKTFIRSYFQHIYDGAMELYLRDLLEYDNESFTNFSADNLPVYKMDLIGHLEQLNLSPEQAKSYVNQAIPQTNAFDKAVKFVQEGKTLKAWKFNKHFDDYAKFNPKKSASINRMKVYMEERNDPAAMVRAARYTLTHFVVDKPIQFILSLLMTAGITEGILMPIQDEMFGPDSIGYFSRMIIGYFMYDFMTSAMSKPWFKLQLDAFYGGESFQHVPEVKEARKGMVNWYLKQTFNNPENGFWLNQKSMWKMITANLRAGLVDVTVNNQVVLGRFDLDSYINGYILAYMPGYYGLSTQLDQGIDMAMGQTIAEFPEELRTHPLVIEYFTKASSEKRMVFNLLFHTFYENPVSLFFENMIHGQGRAFSRLFLNGYTYTELLAMGADNARMAIGKDHIVSEAIRACDHFFTNNYTDFKKYIPKK
ncbi:MAG: hypothetical protein JNM93_05620 [Bacteriovoracaceae bacterium]|nr:hypothetical protein [Bacteriovoracaceae bacterium]